MEGVIQAEQLTTANATALNEDAVVDFQNPYRMHEVIFLNVRLKLFAAA